MVYKDLLSYLTLPDFLTLMGLVLSLSSIFASLSGFLGEAAVLILLSTVLDFSDGRVARKIKRKGLFGVGLDNLGDISCYLIGVSIFGYAAGLTGILAIAVFVFFIVCGSLRLARFSITGTKDGYYEGLPTSYAFIIPIIYFILVGLNISITHLLWFYLIPSFFMISTIKVKKV